MNIKQLRALARERKIKNYIKYNKNKLEKALNLEISKPNERYEKYCRKQRKTPTPVISINKETDEILRFKSLYSAGKHFKQCSQNIKDKIKSKKDLVFNNQSFLVFNE